MPKTAPKIPTDVNKWAGEDEDDPKVSNSDLERCKSKPLSRL